MHIRSENITYVSVHGTAGVGCRAASSLIEGTAERGRWAAASSSRAAAAEQQQMWLMIDVVLLLLATAVYGGGALCCVVQCFPTLLLSLLL